MGIRGDRGELGRLGKIIEKMDVINLEMIKANSRIEIDDEDVLLEEIGDTAEAVVEDLIGRDWASVEAEYGKIPKPLERACLLLADHFYQHRGAVESVGMYDVPWSVDVLVKPYVEL